MAEPENDGEIVRSVAAVLQQAPAEWTEACLAPDRMIALAEGAVAEPEAARLMAHVALCGRCRREYTETLELVSLAGGTEDAAPPRMAGPPAKPAAARSVPAAASAPVGAQRPPSALSRVRLRALAGIAAAAAAAAVFTYVEVKRETRIERERIAAALRARDMEIAQAVQRQWGLQGELNALK